MREESHLDDMRSAIRGDFERLAQRRGGQDLMRQPTGQPDTEPDAEPDAEPAPAPTSLPPPSSEPVAGAEPPAQEQAEEGPELEPEGAVEPEAPEPDLGAGAVVEPEPSGEAPRPRSFLDRLLGR